MYSFDPTHGHDIDTLLEVPYPEGPADFAAFWREKYRQVREIPLEITRRAIPSPFRDTDLYEVEWNSLGGLRIGGWITVPRGQEPQRGTVVGHGYGGREAAEPGIPGPVGVSIFPCARGFHRSATPLYYDQGGKHVLQGIESRDTYVHLGCVADFWTAASVLLELYPGVADRLHYFGGSFGGGIGALLLPWDDRFTRGYLDVPSFGNHPLRVTMQCTGSGESIRLLYKKQPEILEVLQYFDAATAAHHIGIPVFVAAALEDPAVPPPGQFAVYNALGGPKELFVRKTGHPNTAEDDAVLHGELDQWFSQ